LPASADANARQRLIGQVDAGIPGGVLELYVVHRPVLLDQGVFQEQGLHFCIGDYEIQA